MYVIIRESIFFVTPHTVCFYTITMYVHLRVNFLLKAIVQQLIFSSRAPQPICVVTMSPTASSPTKKDPPDKVPPKKASRTAKMSTTHRVIYQPAHSVIYQPIRHTVVRYPAKILRAGVIQMDILRIEKLS